MRLMPLSSAAWIVPIAASSSLPPHIHPPIAQVPSAILDAGNGRPSILIVSILFLLCQRYFRARVTPSSARYRSIGRARLVAGAFDPATAQRSIKIDEVGQALQTSSDARLLGVVKTSLRGKDVEIAVDAVPIAKLRQLQTPLLGRRVALLGGELVVVGAARGEPVRHFAERRLDCFFVLRNADVLPNPRHIQIRPQCSPFEDGHRDRRQE